MAEKATRWWRDPRYLIPGVLIPLLAIVVPMLPRDKVSKQLAITLEVGDPRRTDRLPGMRIEKDFKVKKQRIKYIADNLVEAIEARIKSSVPLRVEDRSPINASVNQAADGILFVEGSGAEKVALHLTRFPEVEDLWDLMNKAHPNMVVQMTMEEATRLPVPRVKELAAPGLNMRAGVYRVVLTAPGYHDAFKYLAHSKDGKLSMTSGFDILREATFPLSMELIPRSGSSGRLNVAVKPFLACAELTKSKPEFKDIGRLIQEDLEAALRQKGFSTLVVGPETDLSFHPYRLKNMEAPPGHQFADFLIEGSCKWVG